MKEQVLVPSVGESITSGILSSWIKKQGEQVEEGEDLFELETDKATVAVPAPAEGLLQILVEEGQEVEIGQVVATLEVRAAAEGLPAETEPAKAEPSKSEPTKVQAGTQRLSPAVRRIVREHGLRVEDIQASGPKGRITKEDALRAVKAKESTPSAERQTRVPMNRLRRTIAERLIQARQQTALLTTFNEIDMESVIAVRGRYRESFEKKYGVRLGFMSFFIKACCQALQSFPVVNAMIDGEQIVYNNYYDIGVAVSTERGLVVPVIRDADRMSFAEIEKAILDLAQRARDKKIAPDELAGGTFTITNGGIFGSLLSTPLPNYPQSAVLGMHAIQKRPIAVGEEVVVRPMMYVALSYDHRLIDGREAVQFLVAVKSLVEDPRRLLLDV